MNRFTTYCILAACSLMACTPMLGQTLSLTSPNGGETLAPGANYQITWIGTSDKDSTRLEYSTDGGSTWNRIVRSVAGTTYDWKVPSMLSSHCLLRAVQVWSEKSGSAKDSTLMKDHLSTAIDITADGSLIAVGDYNTNPITLRSGVTSMLTGHLQGTANKVNSLRFSPDGRYLASAELDSLLHIWTVTDSTLKHSIPLYGISGMFPCFSSDSRKIAVVDVTDDGRPRVFDVETGADLHLIPDTLRNVGSVEFNRGGQYIILGQSSKISIYDAGSGALMRSFANPFKEEIVYVSPNNDGSILAVTGKTRLFLMDATTGDTLVTIGKFPEYGIPWVRFAADNSRLLVKYGGTAVRIYDATMGDLLYTLYGGRNSGMTDAALSADGTTLATSAGSGSDYLFHLLPTDVSDNEFSIAAKGLSVATVDLGTSKVGREKDSTVVGFLSNQGSSSITITSISVVGKDSADFKLTDPSTGTVTLDPGASAAVRFAFTPSGSGLRTAKAMITTSAETLYATITGTGLDTTAGVDAPSPGSGVEALHITGCYPNPVRGEAHLRYAGRTVGLVRLTVTDAMGRVVFEQSEVASGLGEHEIAVDLSSVPSGMYAFKLRSAEQATFGTMIVQH